MTRDEHQKILAFIERTLSDAKMPMDIEADAIIRAMFVRKPDAAYRMTMLAMSLSETAAAPVPLTEVVRQKGWLAGLFDRQERVAARREPVVS